MAGWTITGGDGTATIDNNGNVTFPNNTGSEDITYTVKYEDENGCNGSTEFVVKKCSCNCVCGIRGSIDFNSRKLTSIQYTLYKDCNGEKVDYGASVADDVDVILYENSNPSQILATFNPLKDQNIWEGWNDGVYSTKSSWEGFEIQNLDLEKEYVLKISFCQEKQYVIHIVTHEYKIEVIVEKNIQPHQGHKFFGDAFFFLSKHSNETIQDTYNCHKQRCYEQDTEIFTGNSINEVLSNFISCRNNENVEGGCDECYENTYDPITGITVYNYGVNGSGNDDITINPSDYWTANLDTWNGFNIKYPEGKYLCKISIDWTKDGPDEIEVTYQ